MPITYQPPVEKIETFTVSGAGTFVLTEEQRSSRRLSILVELVRTEDGPPFYYDFRVPEPRTFWGNIQKVSRDYVRGTIPLQFRRHVIHEFDNHLVEQLHQLRCITTVLGFDITENLLQARQQLGLAQADAQVWYENLLTDVANPTLRPVDPVTAIWYEILPLMFAQVTVIWQGYSVQCNDGGFIAFQSPPRATAKDEQRPAPGGGGFQPAVPLPDGRKADPLSDSPAPPPDSPSGPPSPQPGPPPLPPGNYFMTVRIQDRQYVGNICTDRPIREDYTNFNQGNGPGTVENRPQQPGTYNWVVVDRNGAVLKSLISGPTSDPCVSEIVSVNQFQY